MIYWGGIRSARYKMTSDVKDFWELYNLLFRVGGKSEQIEKGALLVRMLEMIDFMIEMVSVKNWK